MRCSGYKKKPSKVYRHGTVVRAGREIATWVPHRPGDIRIYGLGRCPDCKRIVGLAPKAGTIVNHKRP